MKTDKVRRVQEIVNAFNHLIGGAAAKELENELEILVAPMPVDAIDMDGRGLNQFNKLTSAPGGGIQGTGFTPKVNCKK